MAILMYLKHIWQLKTHFTTDYNYQRYGGSKIDSKGDICMKETKKEGISSINYLKDIMNEIYWIILLANFAVDGNKWVGNLINNEKNYTRYRKYKDAFEYHFRNDCVSISND